MYLQHSEGFSVGYSKADFQLVIELERVWSWEFKWGVGFLWVFKEFVFKYIKNMGSRSQKGDL